MSQSVTIDSTITIPASHNSEVISVRLVEDGAVHIAYGIDLFLDESSIRHVATFPKSTPGQVFSLTRGLALRGLGLDCFGRVFLAGNDTTKLHCDFSAQGKVIASSDIATISLTPDNSTREFHIRCSFV